MKHTPQQYAKAFAETAASATGHHLETCVQNFARLIEKNGDAHMAPKILSATARALRAKMGMRHVTITSARPLPHPARTTFAKFLEAHDTIEERTDSALLAGVKITVNDEREFDGSLAGKLTKLFLRTNDV